AKAIRKDRARRYQTASELGNDLDWLGQEMEATPHFKQITLLYRTPKIEAEKVPAPTHKRGISRVPWRRVGAGAALTLGLAVAAAAAYLGYRSIAPKPPSFQAGIKKLTSSGKVTAAAISPDGKYLAYAE